MKLQFPSDGERPVLLMKVQDLLFGREALYRMLLDTGADHTCFPAGYAAAIGHNNAHPHVRKETCSGIGGSSTVFLHSVRLALVDPIKSQPGNFVVAWTSRLNKARFVQAMKFDMGLLGRDVMTEWKSVRLTPTPSKPHSKWLIEIEL